MKKFVIQISGKSCSGKSTLRDVLAVRNPGSYSVSFDRLKWQLSGYSRDNAHDREVLKALLRGVYEVVCKLGLPIIYDNGFRSKEDYEFFRTVAEAHGYGLVFVHLDAPEDVLLERFRERVARAQMAGTKISVTDEAVYRQNLSEIAWYIPEEAMSFDTSVTNAEAIADQVMGKVI